MQNDDLCFLSATEQSELIRSKKISATQLIQAHLDQIERLNPTLNAIVTLTAESAMAEAASADKKMAANEVVGVLHGLPVAHKDLFLTKGVRTTFGSLAFKDFVPDVDSLPVERLKKAGGISLGKTNTPEFGAGSQTFNAIFGSTPNPYDLTKTCGGSSGGGAVALASGMISIADGTDLGGSLRNPASFCNLVGIRPSVGRVPSWPESLGWYTMSVPGPMARTVQDVALAMAAMSGPDDRSPISLEAPGEMFLNPLARSFKGCKIAFSANLGGLPVEPEVAKVIESTRAVFQDLGCEVINDEPNISEADEIFMLWRAWRTELRITPLLKEHRAQIKDTVIWNAEQGLPITGPQLVRAEAKRTELYHRMREFFKKYDFLVLPVSQVAPFSIDQEYPAEINGVKMNTYIDWQKSAYHISALGNPAISVPAGFTSDHLPVGIQIVGRHRDDFGILQLAYAFEQKTQFAQRRPPICSQ
ncbi:amidase [Polynucleobacter sp. AP-Latsch-80-C2]|jgi:amidase|uniref:amidase n=1 Tax=Polynucleobacter sp. AP-Latsch-80-C2 TaxID=2576931 RepID=UPI001C0B4977|nr:amidase [Polynucleobacter sp. AP-Latsch-80-C2]MBU3624309.1 amidase [Polynucleobacter sp. AP-Latsch-80-C2]